MRLPGARSRRRSAGGTRRAVTLVDLLVATSIMSIAMIVFISAALTARGVIDKSNNLTVATQSASSQAATDTAAASSVAVGTSTSSVSGIPGGQLTQVISTYGGSSMLKRADISVTWNASSSKTSYSAGMLSLTTLMSYPNHISNLFNTGVDGAGALLTQGSTDSHWSIMSGPQTGALYVPPPNPAWFARTSNSQWISPSVVQSGAVPAGTYQYRTTFTVTGPALSGLSIAVGCATDDAISDVRLNGTSVATNLGGSSFWTTFNITSGFVTGSNTLDFYVSNVGSTSSGLQVQMTGSP
ncbi:MAG TPA: hypothetical protein VKT77_10930 [Chthonomonadaceae bacterium]|nr:hypothetical protein [Chthonomonadaceae bacterium]